MSEKKVVIIGNEDEKKEKKTLKDRWNGFSEKHPKTAKVMLTTGKIVGGTVTLAAGVMGGFIIAGLIANKNSETPDPDNTIEAEEYTVEDADEAQFENTTEE